MRKIITFGSLLLALVLVVTMFTACGDKNDVEASTTNNEAVDVANGFSAVVKDKEVVIKKDGSAFQALPYPQNYEANFDIEYAKSHNEFIDMNFDGQLDFYVAISSKDDVISYYCWLYNVTSESFDFSVILSGLKNISIDSENQLILSKTVNGDSTSVVSYHWVDGELRLNKAYDSEKESIPEEITKNYEDNAIGTDKPTSSANKNETTNKGQSSGSSDKTTKPNKPSNSSKPSSSDKPVNSEKPTDSGKPSAPSKPSNTTTTGTAIVLETGSLNDNGWY